MNKKYAAQISALAIALVFVSCAIFTIPISADAGYEKDSETGTNAYSGITAADGTDSGTETNITKTGTISNLMASMIVYLNKTTTTKYTQLNQTLNIDEDMTITSSSIITDGSKIVFSDDATLIVDGCTLCLDGNISFIGDVSISLINDASLYLGNIGILTPKTGSAFSIECPSADVEFSTSNDIAYNSEKNAYFNFSLDLKEDSPLRITMGDYTTKEGGFELLIGYNPDGKEIYTYGEFSFGEFVEFIGDKYGGTDQDAGMFTFMDIINFILDSDGKIPTVDIQVFMHDAERNYKLKSTDDDDNMTETKSGSIKIKDLDIVLTTNSEGGMDNKLYADAKCGYIFADVTETKMERDVITIPSSKKVLYTEGSDAALKITSDELTKVYANIESFTFNLNTDDKNGASNSISMDISETELKLKVTSEGAIGFIDMFKSMFESPDNINEVLTSTDLNTISKDSALYLETESVAVTYKDKGSDLNENMITFSIYDANVETILPSNYTTVNAESIDFQMTWQIYNVTEDGRTFCTEINTTESCKDIDMFIDAKDTTPNELMGLIIEVLEFDVKQETIDRIMDYKKNINMTVELSVGTNLLSSETVTSLCTNLGNTVIGKDATSFKMDNASIEIYIDTNGNNKIGLETDLFELSVINGEIGKNTQYPNEYAEQTVYVSLYEFEFNAYASYGHMYKLLVGVYLYTLDDDKTLTISSVQKLFVNFLIQDSSETELNLILKYAEFGTRTDTYVDNEIINTTEHAVCIGDEYSNSQDLSIEMVINIEYSNKTLHLRDSYIKAVAKNDAAITTRTTNTAGEIEKSITGRTALFDFSIKTADEGISVDKIENSMDAAMKQIAIKGSITWGTFSSIDKYKDEASGNTYKQTLCFLDSMMGINTTLGTMANAISNLSTDTGMLMATKDVLDDYSEKTAITSTEIIDIHGKTVSWARFTFTGITISYSENSYVEYAKNVEADVNWDGRYGMYTDGGVYFKNVFRLNSGYTVSDGTDTLEGSTGRIIYVDSFSTSESSDICGGITDAAVGTKLILTKPSDLNDDGYIFRGWMIGDRIFVEASDDDVVYYAPPAGSYTVKYAYGYILTAETSGGTSVSGLCASDGDYIDISKFVTTRDGYTFAGWDCSELDEYNGVRDRMPAHDAKIYAVWTPNVYNVSLDTNGGSMRNNASASMKYTYGSEFALPDANCLDAPTKEGYTVSFLGWYAADDSSKTIITSIKDVVAGDLKYIAAWKETANAYEIKIDANGGTLSTTRIISHTDEKVDISSVTGTKNGYVLDSLQGYTAGMTMPAHSITLKAIWAKVITDDLINEGTDKVTVNTDSEAVKISKDNVESLLEKSQDKNIEISFSDILVNLSPEAIKRLSMDNYGNYSDMNMSVVRSAASDMNLSSSKNSHIKEVISINVNSKGTSDNLGSVNVSIPLKDGEDGATYKVYYVDDNGKMTEMRTVCTVVDGITILTFITDHFSDYAIMSEEKSTEEQNSNISMYVIIGIAAAALILLGVVVYARIVKQ